MAEVVFVDTSVLMNLLNVPGKNSDSEGTIAEFKTLWRAGVTFVIPIAAVIETGNHIAQLSDGTQRRDRSDRFETFLRSSLEGARPWVVSGTAWNQEFLSRLVDGEAHLPGLTDLCVARIGSGDASILHELNGYRLRTDLPSALPVRLWTLDAGLSTYA